MIPKILSEIWMCISNYARLQVARHVLEFWCRYIDFGQFLALRHLGLYSTSSLSELWSAGLDPLLYRVHVVLLIIHTMPWLTSAICDSYLLFQPRTKIASPKRNWKVATRYFQTEFAGNHVSGFYRSVCVYPELRVLCFFVVVV